MSTNKFSTSIMNTIITDWHNANCNSIINKLPNYQYLYYCDNYQSGRNCSCNCYKSKPKCHYKPIEYTSTVLQYTFKQQVHYMLCTGTMQLSYLTNSTGNGQSYLNMNNYTYIAPSILSNPNNSTLATTPIPVVYPDYSTTDCGVGIQWPAKVFSPYVDTTAWPTFQFTNATGVKFFNLGFIVTQNYNVCEPSWATYYPAGAGPVNDQIKALRQAGGDVCVSFGGAAGMPIHINAPDVPSLFKQYQLFCDAYGMTRIDFDIEGAWVSSAYATENMNNAMALKMLQDYYTSNNKSIEIWFTLPILPTGLTPDGVAILQQTITAGVEIGGVNAMIMDYGDSVAPNSSGQMGQYGIQSITSLMGQLNTLYNGSKTSAELWAMIGTTPMLGVNDVSTETFGLSDAQQTLSFAQMNSIGMISMWSSNRDYEVTPVTGIPQQSNDFTKIFNQYN